MSTSKLGSGIPEKEFEQRLIDTHIIVRLSLFRQEGKVFHSLSLRWQEDICKVYILSNLGFTFSSWISLLIWLAPKSDVERLECQTVIACIYPLLCTIIHGLFAIVLTTYLLLLGRRMVASVINKGLQKRVYILIFLASSFLPLRVILLGFSVLARQEHFLFKALVFYGFLVLFLYVVVGIFMVVYLPVAELNQDFNGFNLCSH
ncbi:uncharacterized protein [Spinacia oleracea]|uniref:THH1/TOM1/TOM3 domain-containing protein n=1 Tax=Spinacia oleracea TaxID=3562 RepID=A0ABM3QZ42_SPIOL|nr:uncharacterized protein LOC110791157 [Spinacia oleracea]